MQPLQLLLTCAVLLSSVSVGAVAAAQIPLIVPQQVTVAQSKQCVGAEEDSSCAEINISLETTAVSWLDHLLVARIDFAGEQTADSQPSDLQQHLAQAKQHADDLVAKKYQELKGQAESDEPYIGHFEHLETIRFIAQRYHLASFKQFSYDYSGGAHGMHEINYLLFDLKTQRQVLLKDMLQPFAHAKLFELLRESYQQHYPDYAQRWLDVDLSQQADILLTDNFLFTEEGLTFSYPPYVLGPYVEGDMRLSLAYGELSEILQADYQLGD